jgi:hypothetical protein
MNDLATNTSLQIRISYGVIIAIIAALLILAFIDKSADKGIITAIVVLVALLAFVPFIGRIKIFSAGIDGIKIEQDIQIVKHAAQVNSDLINKFIFLAMPTPTYENLVKFAHPPFGSYSMTEGFRQQIRYLRDTGLVQVEGAVAQIPNNDELSKYVTITDLGTEFIRLRKQILKGSEPQEQPQLGALQENVG